MILSSVVDRRVRGGIVPAHAGRLDKVASWVRMYSPTPRLSSDSGRLKPPKSTALELESGGNMPDFVQSAVDAFITAVASATRGEQPSSEQSPKQSPPIRLLRPDTERNGAILETAPTFEWQLVDGAEKYTLIIRAEDWELSESLNANQTRYTLPPISRSSVAVNKCLCSRFSTCATLRVGGNHGGLPLQKGVSVGADPRVCPNSHVEIISRRHLPAGARCLSRRRKADHPTAVPRAF